MPNRLETHNLFPGVERKQFDIATPHAYGEVVKAKFQDCEPMQGQELKYGNQLVYALEKSLKDLGISLRIQSKLFNANTSVINKLLGKKSVLGLYVDGGVVVRKVEEINRFRSLAEKNGLSEQDHQKIQQYLWYRTLAHELYHSTGSVNTSGIGGRRKVFRGKLLFDNDPSRNGWEEGLACYWSTHLTEQCNLPELEEGKVLYLSLLTAARKGKYIIEGSTLVHPERLYPNSTALVEYLHDKSDKAGVKLSRYEERCRVLGEVKPLQEIVDDTFGGGAFQMLTFVNEQNARTALDILSDGVGSSGRSRYKILLGKGR